MSTQACIFCASELTNARDRSCSLCRHIWKIKHDAAQLAALATAGEEFFASRPREQDNASFKSFDEWAKECTRHNRDHRTRLSELWADFIRAWDGAPLPSHYSRIAFARWLRARGFKVVKASVNTAIGIRVVPGASWVFR